MDTAPIDAIDWNGQDGRIIRAAMHQMLVDAHYHANAAGQDRCGLRYRPGAVEAYLRDAKELERLLAVTCAIIAKVEGK